MDALREWMESDLDVIMVGPWMRCGNGWSLIWTLISWLAHGLRERMECDLDVITVGPWMLCRNGWNLIWIIMVGTWVPLRECMESDLDVIMVGTWMLCEIGWSLIWTLSWLAHGCSAGMDGFLCENGWSRHSTCIWQRMLWQSDGVGNGCSAPGWGTRMGSECGVTSGSRA